MKSVSHTLATQQQMMVISAGTYRGASVMTINLRHEEDSSVLTFRSEDLRADDVASAIRDQVDRSHGGLLRPAGDVGGDQRE